jgi:hypothetical protein
MADPRIDEVLAAEKQRQDALIRGDFPALAGMLDDSLVHTHANGVVQDKPTYLRFMQETVTVLAIKRTNLSVRVFGEVAVVSGGMIQTLRQKNSAAPVAVATEVLQVWIKTPERWKQVAWQTTRAAESP